MFNQLKSLSLASAVVVLFSASATAWETPRLALDWEPNPKDRSHIKVVYDCCGNPKIKCLIGGKKIRPRVQNASSLGF